MRAGCSSGIITVSATFSNFGHKISLLASRDRTVSQDYIDVRGRSEESICQFLRNIAGDTHNLSVLRHYMVPHLPDKIHLRHLRDHTVLAHTSRLIKAEKIKIIVESNNPDMRSIFGFSVIRVSANLEERRQQEIELKVCFINIHFLAYPVKKRYLGNEDNKKI